MRFTYIAPGMEAAAKRAQAILDQRRRRMACGYLGRQRPDLPHAGPCRMPYECGHPQTPAVVTRKACGGCRYRTSDKRDFASNSRKKNAPGGK